MTVNKFLLLPLVAALGGCMHAPIKDTASPFYNPPVGTTFLLNQEIPVAAGNGRVFFQNGEASTSGFDHYTPHCQLDIKGISDGALVLKPKTYKVSKVTYKTPFIVLKEPIRLASRSELPMLASRNNDGPDELIEVVEMVFQPDQNNQALKLTCGGVQDLPSRAEPPSIDEIRFALGAVASLQLPQ